MKRQFMTFWTSKWVLGILYVVKYLVDGLSKPTPEAP